MSKVMLALGSFIVGACCAFAVSAGIQTSTWAQSSSPTPPFSEAIHAPMLIPIVPGIMSMELSDSEFSPTSQQQLDGLNCIRCTFHAVVLTYAGGAFRLTDSKFDGVTRIALNGPALNTVALLTQLGAFRPQTPKAPPAFETPHKFEAGTDSTVQFNAISPSPITLISVVR